MKHPLIRLKILLLNQMDGLLHTQERKKHLVPPFVRITSNGTFIYEGFSPTGSYRYAWTPLFPVKRETQLSFDLQVGEGIDDGQIGILFLRE